MATRYKESGGKYHGMEVSNADLDEIDEDVTTRSGIPIPMPLRDNVVSSLISWLYMFGLLYFLCWAATTFPWKEESVPLISEGTLHIRTQNCKVHFLEGDEPRLVLRHLKAGGHSMIDFDDEASTVTVTANMERFSSFPYFSCNLFVYAPRDFAYDTLTVHAHNAVPVVVAAFAPIKAEIAHLEFDKSAGLAFQRSGI